MKKISNKAAFYISSTVLQYHVNSSISENCIKKKSRHIQVRLVTLCESPSVLNTHWKNLCCCQKIRYLSVLVISPNLTHDPQMKLQLNLESKLKL